ncbi:outer membrane beta-barrel protein [Methylocapsa sp. D3K7]|uniref:outer membrane protein n=1 Tax=Methylocapsa sp. D3K7 TaxID=3041435 RepID=UPI00244EE360|nr:outer membrane beta-barrel protein [Methylocapsa sp. D3K7]WGJ13662.1 outer membrane beta-barrel protein [Methylocapsa sp. D3K7]
MIKKLSILGASLAALCSSAVLAADLPVAPPPPPFIPYSWTGIYLGVNLGLGGDRFQYPFSVSAPIIATFASGNASITSSGIIGGGQIGYNWEFANNVVLGFETDFDGAAIRGKVTANLNGVLLAALPFGANVQAGSRINYIGTVRGRLGYAWDRFLVYGTGGFAYGQVNSAISASAAIGGGAAAFTASENNSRTGFAVGGGFEYAVTNNLTLKTEYLYVNLGTNNIINTSLLGVVGLNVNQKTQVNIARAGINYKFNWFNPIPAVVARY